MIHTALRAAVGHDAVVVAAHIVCGKALVRDHIVAVIDGRLRETVAAGGIVVIPYGTEIIIHLYGHRIR